MDHGDSGIEGIKAPSAFVTNVVELAMRTPDVSYGISEAGFSKAAVSTVLRFWNGASDDVNAFRISAFFESEPELDGVVGSMIRNGFRYISDLNAARVNDVFANSDARLDERRRIIERLRAQAGVRLVS